MTRINGTRMSVSAALCLSLIAGLLSTAGCWNSGPVDQPLIKQALLKRGESFRGKTKAKMGNAAAAVKRPG